MWFQRRGEDVWKTSSPSFAWQRVCGGIRLIPWTVVVSRRSFHQQNITKLIRIGSVNAFDNEIFSSHSRFPLPFLCKTFLFNVWQILTLSFYSYCNSRILKFSAAGKLLNTWGTPSYAGPGTAKNKLVELLLVAFKSWFIVGQEPKHKHNKVCIPSLERNVTLSYA